MTEKEKDELIESLQDQRAEMEGDVKATLEVFRSIIESLGIDFEQFKGKEEEDFAKHIPGLLQSLITKVTFGGFDMATFQKIKALSPVLDKYKHLLEDFEE